MTARPDFTSQDYFRDPAAAIESCAIKAGRGSEVPDHWHGVGDDDPGAGRQVLKDTKTFTIRKDDGRCGTALVDAGHRAHAGQQHAVDGRTAPQTAARYRRRSVSPPRRAGDGAEHSAIADKLADELFAEGSPADLVERYARKLPLSVICELLGLPAADRPKFTAWASGFTRLTGALGFVRMMPEISP